MKKKIILCIIICVVANFITFLNPNSGAVFASAPEVDCDCSKGGAWVIDKCALVSTPVECTPGHGITQKKCTEVNTVSVCECSDEQLCPEDI